MKATWTDMGVAVGIESGSEKARLQSWHVSVDDAEHKAPRADEPSSVGRTLMLENEAGIIVAKLYVQENGNLHPDSWIKTGDVI